jgi:ubiquitin-protein ligase
MAADVVFAEKQRPCMGCYQADDNPQLRLGCGHSVHVGVAIRVPRTIPGRQFFCCGRGFACLCLIREVPLQASPESEPLANALSCPECSYVLSHLECCSLLPRDIYLQYGLARQTSPKVQQALVALAKEWSPQLTEPVGGPSGSAGGSSSPRTPNGGKVSKMQQLTDLIYFYQGAPHPKMGEILTEMMMDADLKESDQEKIMGMIEKLVNGLSLVEQAPSSGAGVGYGGSEQVVLVDSEKDRQKRAEKQQKKDEAIAVALRQVKRALDSCGVNLGAATEATMRKDWGALSCLAEYLRNGSLNDVIERLSVYRAVFDVCDAIAGNPMLVPLMLSCKPLAKNIRWSPEAALSLAKQRPSESSEVMDVVVEEVEGASLFESISALSEGINGDSPEETELKRRCTQCLDLVASNQSKHPHIMYDRDDSAAMQLAVRICNSLTAKLVDKSNHYKRIMSKYAFRMVNFTDVGIPHSLLDIENRVKDPSVSTRGSSSRVDAKEHLIALRNTIAALRTSCPVEWSSSIFCLADEHRYDVLKFLIIGPEGTPYQDGCFVFDMLLPPSFPTEPPKAKFMTTGGGKVRFNPNLYQDGKVCLSLLGTWHGPGWNPKESTILQVLLSLQSLVLVTDPFCNEPGHEEYQKSPEGRKRIEDYNQTIIHHTVQLAILETLEHPPKGFEDVVRDHFKLKKASVISTCAAWRRRLEGARVQPFEFLLGNLRTVLDTPIAVVAVQDSTAATL